MWEGHGLTTPESREDSLMLPSRNSTRTMSSSRHRPSSAADRRGFSSSDQRRAVEYMRVEVECGVVGGDEDGIGDQGVSRDRLYTTPGDLLQVAEALGTGAGGRYLLAATFGNVHGVYAPAKCSYARRSLPRVQEALERAHAGARFQYVFQGSSGSSPEELRGAVDNGVVKVNLDTEAQYAFTYAAAGHRWRTAKGCWRKSRRSATSAPTTRAPGAPRPSPRWRGAFGRHASSSDRLDAASCPDKTEAVPGARDAHGWSRKARAGGDQLERANAHNSRACGGSSGRTELRTGEVTMFVGTSAGPSPAAASAATPAI
jgi:Fructose-bisphosphate aldolase class-II